MQKQEHRKRYLSDNPKQANDSSLAPKIASPPQALTEPATMTHPNLPSQGQESVSVLCQQTISKQKLHKESKITKEVTLARHAQHMGLGRRDNDNSASGSALAAQQDIPKNHQFNECTLKDVSG